MEPSRSLLLALSQWAVGGRAVGGAVTPLPLCGPRPMGSWAGPMGGRVGGAWGRGRLGPAGRWVGCRARVLRCRCGSGFSAVLGERIPSSMAVEEEGLRVFQSVKIKIGERPRTGWDGGGVFAVWRRAPPGLLPSPGDARSRVEAPPHFLGTVGPPPAAPFSPPPESGLGRTGRAASGDAPLCTSPALRAAPSPWRRSAGLGSPVRWRRCGAGR